jgi:hypothetical protein
MPEQNEYTSSDFLEEWLAHQEIPPELKELTHEERWELTTKRLKEWSDAHPVPYKTYAEYEQYLEKLKSEEYISPGAAAQKVLSELSAFREEMRSEIEEVQATQRIIIEMLTDMQARLPRK